MAALSAGLIAATVMTVGRATSRGRQRKAVARLTDGRRSSALSPGALASGPWRTPPGWWVSTLDRAAVPIDPTTAWRLWLLAPAAVGLLAGSAAGVPAGLLAALAAATGPPALLHSGRHRRAQAREAQLPAFLAAVSAALRGGASPVMALEAAATTEPSYAPDVAVVAGHARHGAGVAAGLATWAAAYPDDEGVRLTATALAVGVATGGRLAPAIDGAAHAVAARLELMGEVRILTAQARTSATVLAAAPLVFALGAMVTDPAIGSFLLTSPLGLLMLTTGLVLDGLGAAWMMALVRRAAAQ